MIFGNFRKFSKILENQWVSAQAGYPGWPATGRPGGAGGAREVVGSVRGVAAGVPGSSSVLVMLLGVSLPLYTAIGGT